MDSDKNQCWWRGVYILSLCIEILTFVIYVDELFWLLIGDMYELFFNVKYNSSINHTLLLTFLEPHKVPSPAIWVRHVEPETVGS